MKLGDKEVANNSDFRFSLTTKLSHPHYTPEISTKVTYYLLPTAYLLLAYSYY